MKTILLRAAAISVVLAAVAAASAAEPPLQRLSDGNRRFASDTPMHQRQDSARRRETAEVQHPFAIVLSCADSRVPPEVLFDQGIGDLFVVRVAGNVAGVNETASIEYAAEHLHAPLCVVLGHSGCGAVKAAVSDARFSGNLDSLMVELAPVVKRVRYEHPNLPPAEFLDAAVETNVRYSIETLLRRSSVIRDLVREGRLQIVGAVYDLASGKVRWLRPDPQEARLLEAMPH